MSHSARNRALEERNAEREKAKARRKIERLEVGELKLDDHLPLLLKSTIDDLPPIIQKLCDEGLDSIRDAQTNVEYLPASIPPHPRVFFIAALFLFPFSMYSIFKWKSAIVGTLLLVCTAVVFATGMTLYERRKPIYGSRKPWPGNWNSGVYLVGSSALFEMVYDWTQYRLETETNLFPMTSIISVERINNSGKIMLKVRSPPGAENETFEHILDAIHEPDKAFTKIKDWFERSTNK